MGRISPGLLEKLHMAAFWKGRARRHRIWTATVVALALASLGAGATALRAPQVLVLAEEGFPVRSGPPPELTRPWTARTLSLNHGGGCPGRTGPGPVRRERRSCPSDGTGRRASDRGLLDGVARDTRLNSFSLVKSLIGPLVLRAVADHRLEGLDVPLRQVLGPDAPDATVGEAGFIVLGIFVMNSQGHRVDALHVQPRPVDRSAVPRDRLPHRPARLQDDPATTAARRRSPQCWPGSSSSAGLSSLSLPGLSPFVSEFLVMTGAFVHNWWYAVFAVLGIVLAALYILLMYQRTMTGPVRPAWRRMRDLGLREVAALAPLLALILAFGFFPKPLIDVIEPAVRDDPVPRRRRGPRSDVTERRRRGLSHELRGPEHRVRHPFAAADRLQGGARRGARRGVRRPRGGATWCRRSSPGPGSLAAFAATSGSPPGSTSAPAGRPRLDRRRGRGGRRRADGVHLGCAAGAVVRQRAALRRAPPRRRRERVRRPGGSPTGHRGGAPGVDPRAGADRGLPSDALLGRRHDALPGGSTTCSRCSSPSRCCRCRCTSSRAGPPPPAAQPGGRAQVLPARCLQLRLLALRHRAGLRVRRLDQLAGDLGGGHRAHRRRGAAPRRHRADGGRHAVQDRRGTRSTAGRRTSTRVRRRR